MSEYRGLKIGVDVDGVLADFNSTYIRRILRVTGKDRFPGPYGTFPITAWHYPESFGYTAEEISAVWADIRADAFFWETLGEYDTTHTDIRELTYTYAQRGDDIYFITARPGMYAKFQTESWLRTRIARATALYALVPTVLITPHKGLAVRTLDLDIYIDDRWENCVDVAQTKTKTYLMNRTWNEEYNASAYGITRVQSVVDMLRLVGSR